MDVIDNFTGDYRFLSNFYQYPFEFKGLVYPNAEAAFQAQKCSSESDKVKYTQIKKPVIAKRMGKKEPGFPSNWNEISYGIMKEILEAKFSMPELKDRLLSTGQMELIEGNHWHDNLWGACACEKCRSKEQKNLLGKALMEIREELRNR